MVERQNRMKNDQVMAIQTLAKSGRAANFEPISGYFGHIFKDRDFIFVLPIITIKSDGQTKFKANRT